MKQPITSKEERSTKKKGRWKEKVYSKQLVEYVNQSLRPDEIGVYNAFFNSISDKYDICEPHELMMLDIACYDFIRIKRIHHVLMKEGDVTQIKLRTGQTVTKAHEAGYLLNAVETQFRQNMKELMLTRKEQVKKQIGLTGKDFASFMSDTVDADFREVKKEELKDETDGKSD